MLKARDRVGIPRIEKELLRGPRSGRRNRAVYEYAMYLTTTICHQQRCQAYRRSISFPGRSGRRVRQRPKFRILSFQAEPPDFSFHLHDGILTFDRTLVVPGNFPVAFSFPKSVFSFMWLEDRVEPFHSRHHFWRKPLHPPHRVGSSCHGHPLQSYHRTRHYDPAQASGRGKKGSKDKQDRC